MPSLIILAAGMSSRYGGLKQLDAMGPHGETVLDYSVFDAIRAGFDHLVFVIREETALEFQAGIGSRFSDLVKLDYAFQKLDDLPPPYLPPPERSKPWGTTHAVLAARNFVTDSFAVINADDFYGRDAYVQAMDFLSQSKSTECALVAYPVENTLSQNGLVNRGLCTVKNGFLESVEEVVRIGREEGNEMTGEWLDGKRKEVPAHSKVSMNFWIFPEGFMGELSKEFCEFLASGVTETGECYIPSSVDALIQKGKFTCRVLDTEASWFGVTYPEDKKPVMAAILDLISKGEYPSPLRS